MIKKRLSDIIYILVGIVLCMYFSYQLYLFVDKPYKTETAVLHDYSLNVTFDGYFVRQEDVIDIPKKHVVAYNYSDGQKVTVSTDVAKFYKTEQDIINVNRLNECNTMIKMLVENQSEGAIKGARLDIAVSQVEQDQIQYISMLDNLNLSNSVSVINDLTNSLNKLQAVKNQRVDFSQTIKDLKAEAKRLKSSELAVVESVKSTGTGYFSSQIDGLEKDFTIDSMDKLTYSKFDSLMQMKSASNSPYVGKLVRSSDWYYVASIAKAKTKEFNIGQAVNLSFMSNVNETILTTVDNIIVDPKATKDIIIFRSDVINENIINERFSKAVTNTSRYKGVAVSKETVRFKDGKKGVYILIAGMPVFKLIDSIYEDDDIVISKVTIDQAYVSQYDQVIVLGKNVYGKQPTDIPNNQSEGARSSSSGSSVSSKGDSSSGNSSENSSEE